jgi:hypothetical protein
VGSIQFFLFFGLSNEATRPYILNGVSKLLRIYRRS